MTREIPLSRILYGTNFRSERDEDVSELAKNIEKVYGDNGKEYVRNNHIAAGKIIGDLQKKNREVTKVQKDGFTIEHNGKTITVKCESVDVVNYVVAELKKI